ncbi:hypothetical protein MC378_10495 [Polaribacter sp. MSW13]|uniref:Uncharacterized protein n=1 Tax=Polaribacter marinus TaxID=2916838 RepID=A0A9X1VRD7_9FLAO|nr:hypothetical protein [Polaribacter marinus]MCI2229597.1 hypothetical protein [Polaribacter marinus]
MPPKWRKSIHIAFLKVLVAPFKSQLRELNEERDINIYTLIHDARVGKVEKMLNDNFDSVGRTITIGSGNRLTSNYLYKNSEARQTYLPQSIYTQSEIASRNTDFTILVPEALSLQATDLERLKYLVKYYTGKDKQFKVEIV